MAQAASSVLHSDAREREAQLLAELVRLSPATVLLAESGAEKSSFLAESVLPLLAASAAGETELCILFDSWTDTPLPKLLAQIRRAVPVLDSRRANEEVPSISLAATLARWQHGLDATFIIVLDRFEEHLVAPQRPGAGEFDDELVRVMKMPELRVHFVVALEAEAAPLLEPLRQRIPGLGDTVIRLPRARLPTAPEPSQSLVGSAPKTEPLVGSARAEARVPPEAPEESTPPIPTAFVGSVEREAATVPVEAPRPETRTDVAAATAFRLPRAAWAVLGLLLFSALGLLLLTIWQPRTDVARGTAPKADEPANAAVADASSVESAPSSPADDQVALPLIKGEVPRALPAASAPEATATAAQASAAPRSTPMVFVHVRSEGQRAWAERLIQPLAKRGIRVTGIRVVKAGPGEVDLRYFRAEEAGEAARVARVLREAGLPPPRLKRVAGFESRSTPGHFELWLASGTPQPSKPSKPPPRQHP